MDSDHAFRRRRWRAEWTVCGQTASPGSVGGFGLVAAGLLRPRLHATVPHLAMLCSVLLVVCVGILPVHAAGPARNLILLIPDGCPAEAYTLARWYSGSPLALDGILVGAVKTYIADSVIADSAPAASAYATGVRTSDKHIAVGPREQCLKSLPTPSPDLRYRPLATVLEGARLLGKSTGVVATSSITHATPAAFMSHVPSRRLEAEIMGQAVHQSLTVAFGGGLKYLLPVGTGVGGRTDGRDLSAELRRQGTALITACGPEWEALAAPGGNAPARVFGLFAPEAMAPDCERAAVAPQQPSLEQMTRQALAVLSRDPEGFFLMVEGSQIDWAAHANDPGYLVTELLAFDRAVAAALEFARQDGATLVVAVSDHATGGLSIGNASSSTSYSQTAEDELCGPLRGMNCTAKTVWKRATTANALRDAEAAVRGHTGTDASAAEALAFSLRRAVADAWGIALCAEAAAEIVELAVCTKGVLEEHYALGQVVSRRYTALGWTTHGHSGGDVALYAFGPGAPAGLLDAPQVADVCAAALGLDLEALNRRLFAPAEEFFPGAVTVAGRDIDGDGTPDDWLLRLGADTEAVIGTNRLRLGDREHDLEGLILLAPEPQRVYLPLAAVRLIRGTAVELPAVER